MKTVLIALLIIGACIAVDDVKSIVKRIDKSRFGRTILDTIYLQLQTGDPLDRLLSTLSDLEDRYVAEQKEDDAAHQDYQQSCNSDIVVYDQDLANSNSERIRLEAKLEGDLYPRREIYTGIVSSKTKELNSLKADVVDLDNQRAEENAEFEQKVLEHNEATSVITECRRIFTENFEAPAGESAFVQKGKRVHPKAKLTVEGLSLVQKHLNAAAKRANKFTFRKSWGKFFKLLATIATRAEQLANQGAVDHIIQLCDDLLAQIEDSLNLERFAEDKRVQAYKKALNLLNISIVATGTALANAETELASVNDQIAQAETALENVNLRIENVSEAREDRYEQCEEEATDYMDGRKARDDDRQVVSDTVGLVNQQLRGLKEQLALRLQAGDSFEE